MMPERTEADRPDPVATNGGHKFHMALSDIGRIKQAAWTATGSRPLPRDRHNSAN